MKTRQKTAHPSKIELDTIQSNLSFSYLHAVVSRVGGSCVRTDQTADNMGVDANLTFQGEFSPKAIYRKITIDVQLKSSRQSLSSANGNISYRLKSEQYQRYLLRSTTEFLLILFVLPEKPESWLELSPQELILRKCCYWTSLKGAPPWTGKDVTVYLPEKNLFNVEQLYKILSVLSKGEELKYES